MIKKESRNPWLWVPSLYVAEGLPYVMVMMVSGTMYKSLNISNTELALYTSWLYLPVVIKPWWTPVCDLLITNRFLILVMQKDNRKIWMKSEKNYKMKTAINIPEFDSLHNITKGMISFVKKMDRVSSVTIINPFQGNLALAIMHYLKHEKIDLVSKYLLSLTYSEKNLNANGFSKVKKINTSFLNSIH